MKSSLWWPAFQRQFAGIQKVSTAAFWMPVYFFLLQPSGDFILTYHATNRSQAYGLRLQQGSVYFNKQDWQMALQMALLANSACWVKIALMYTHPSSHHVSLGVVGQGAAQKRLNCSCEHSLIWSTGRILVNKAHNPCVLYTQILKQLSSVKVYLIYCF